MDSVMLLDDANVCPTSAIGASPLVRGRSRAKYVDGGVRALFWLEAAAFLRANNMPLGGLLSDSRHRYFCHNR
jgi:hypothetical protein